MNIRRKLLNIYEKKIYPETKQTIDGRHQQLGLKLIPKIIGSNEPSALPLF